jgi:hypothetical protein
MPVGRVNALKPLGHSGHRRLQDVVGSKEIEIGYPHWTGLFKIRPTRKLVKTFVAFHTLRKLSLLKKFKLSLMFTCGIV